MEPYYREDLSRIHAEGFGAYAESCAPGALNLIESDVGVLEIGCGAGALTRQLIDAGHEVLATDASEAMLDLLSALVPEADSRLLRMPSDPVPAARAIVSVGHMVNYLDSAEDVREAITSMAEAVEPGGILIMDVCDLTYGAARSGVIHSTVTGDRWEIDVTTMFEPPARFIRGLTTRVELEDGTIREDHETHVNVLVDVEAIVSELIADDYEVALQTRIGEFELPEGIYALVLRV